MANASLLVKLDDYSALVVAKEAGESCGEGFFLWIGISVLRAAHWETESHLLGPLRLPRRLLAFALEKDVNRMHECETREFPIIPSLLTVGYRGACELRRLGAVVKDVN